MHPLRLLGDDGTASSVVGTVLMVGAVVGLVVFDVGDRVTEPVPETSLDVGFEGTATTRSRS